MSLPPGITCQFEVRSIRSAGAFGNAINPDRLEKLSQGSRRPQQDYRVRNKIIECDPEPAPRGQQHIDAMLITLSKSHDQAEK
jgi:hypothetical protein